MSSELRSVASGLSSIVPSGASSVVSSLSDSWSAQPYPSDVEIVSLRNGKLFDVSGFNRDNGAQLHCWEATGAVNQRFRLVPRGVGVYEIQSFNGRYLDIEGGKHENGAKLHTWQSCDGPNQRFTIDHIDGRPTSIRAVHSGKAVDVRSGGMENGTRLQQWDHDPMNPNQKFRILKADSIRYQFNDKDEFRIRSLVSGKYFEIKGAEGGNGAKVVMGDSSGAPNQKFQLKLVAPQTYSITALHSGRVVDIAGESHDRGAHAHQWEYIRGENQHFFIQHVNGLPTQIVANHSKKSLDVAGGGKEAGTQIHQWDTDETNVNQWFVIERVDK